VLGRGAEGWRTWPRNDDVLLDFGERKSSATLSEAWWLEHLRFWLIEETSQNINGGGGLNVGT
jgi:hypothetical protein